MSTGQTGFSDVAYDLISVQYHALKGGYDYGEYVRDAENAGDEEIASFFRTVMEEDSARAKQCHEFLVRISGHEEGGPAMTGRAHDGGASGRASGSGTNFPDPAAADDGPIPAGPESRERSISES
ncbi:hypothetical protein [Streptomyces kaniharaensis]|uniref:hypothetical protein n=1 Tax=Streptomyces kaniharaensis TaxID=212423 RepID=UPI001E597C7B|nr:hypothetical protein [Streptomyces kaniharaensis]